MMGQTLRFLDPFMEFMSLPDEKDVGGDVESEGEVESIEFRNVSFKYPGSDMLVLDDISFKISKGEKISIVGLNGAGKTTLVKLVCRLYRPMSGKILINGRDVFEYDYTSYMKKIAAVFRITNCLHSVLRRTLPARMLEKIPKEPWLFWKKWA